MPRTITPQQLDAALALRDLSDPAGGPHAMQLVPAAITSYNDYMTSTRSSSLFTSPRPQAGVSARVGLS